MITPLRGEPRNAEQSPARRCGSLRARRFSSAPGRIKCPRCSGGSVGADRAHRRSDRFDTEQPPPDYGRGSYRAPSLRGESRPWAHAEALPDNTLRQRRGERILKKGPALRHPHPILSEEGGDLQGLCQEFRSHGAHPEMAGVGGPMHGYRVGYAAANPPAATTAARRASASASLAVRPVNAPVQGHVESPVRPPATAPRGPGPGPTARGCAPAGS